MQSAVDKSEQSLPEVQRLVSQAFEKVVQENP